MISPQRVQADPLISTPHNCRFYLLADIFKTHLKTDIERRHVSRLDHMRQDDIHVHMGIINVNWGKNVEKVHHFLCFAFAFKHPHCF